VEHAKVTVVGVMEVLTAMVGVLVVSGKLVVVNLTVAPKSLQAAAMYEKTGDCCCTAMRKVLDWQIH
jgi:hypothetical protein